MPTSPPVPPETVRAIVITQSPSRVFHNVLYYEPDTVVIDNQSKIQAVADAIDLHLRERWLACISSACSFKGVLCYYNSDPDIFFEAMSQAGVAPGTGFDDNDLGEGTLPDETVLTIRKLTGLAGREDRGRVFVSGIPETWSVNGRLDADVVGTAQALSTRIPGDVTLPDALGILHARHWNRKDTVMRPIIGAMVNSILESRRDRRKPLRSVPIAGSGLEE